MAIVKKPTIRVVGQSDSEGEKTSASVREAEAQHKKARTLAKQQQAAECIAAATGQFSSGINEAVSAAEELKRASDQIARLSLRLQRQFAKRHTTEKTQINQIFNYKYHI